MERAPSLGSAGRRTTGNAAKKRGATVAQSRAAMAAAVSQRGAAQRVGPNVLSCRWSEALHGVARDGLATSFPQICGTPSVPPLALEYLPRSTARVPSSLHRCAVGNRLLVAAHLTPALARNARGVPARTARPARPALPSQAVAASYSRSP